jgi:hypothetical protein
MRRFLMLLNVLALAGCSGEDIDYQMPSVYKGDVYALQVTKCEGFFSKSCRTRTVALFEHRYDCQQESYWGAYEQPKMKRGRSGGTECISTLRSKLPEGMVLSPNFR